MSKFKKVMLLAFVMLISITNLVFASSQVNMNLASSSNSAIQNVSSNVVSTNSTNSVASNVTKSTNTAAIVKSVNESDTTTAGLGMSEIINILLIAVGFVLILLAFAILIRLKNQ